VSQSSGLASEFESPSDAVLIVFIAGLLYLLRFERLDNLVAYCIPSETGLLIPSVYNNISNDAGPVKGLGLWFL